MPIGSNGGREPGAAVDRRGTRQPKMSEGLGQWGGRMRNGSRLFIFRIRHIFCFNLFDQDIFTNLALCSIMQCLFCHLMRELCRNLVELFILRKTEKMPSMTSARSMYNYNLIDKILT